MKGNKGGNDNGVRNIIWDRSAPGNKEAGERRGGRP